MDEDSEDSVVELSDDSSSDSEDSGEHYYGIRKILSFRWITYRENGELIRVREFFCERFPKWIREKELKNHRGLIRDYFRRRRRGK